MTKNDLDSAIEIAQEADKILREEFDRLPSISYEGEADLATEAHKRSERCVVERIQNIFSITPSSPNKRTGGETTSEFALGEPRSIVSLQHLLNWERPPCTERKSLNQECGWKDGDRGGPARARNPQEGKRKQKEKKERKKERNTLDFETPELFGRL